MALSLGSLLLATILFLNGLAVLNEERFLKRVGWGYEENLNEPPTFKKQVINLLYAVRVLLRGEASRAATVCARPGREASGPAPRREPTRGPHRQHTLRCRCQSPCSC